MLQYAKKILKFVKIFAINIFVINSEVQWFVINIKKIQEYKKYKSHTNFRSNYYCWRYENNDLLGYAYTQRIETATILFHIVTFVELYFFFFLENTPQTC